MEMQELEITINREGRVQVAVRGIRGEGCLGIATGIESAVGTVEKREYTAEFYEQPVQVCDRCPVTR